MKQKRIVFMISILCVCFLCFLVIGCGTTHESDNKFYLYYLNQEKNAVVNMEYESIADLSDTESLLEEIVGKINTGTENIEYQRAFPDEVRMMRYEYDKSVVFLYFNDAYLNMSTAEEVLCRSAVVRSLIQIDGVYGVSFYVDDQPLKDANGEDVGVMTKDSFADNPGEEIHDIQTADIVLYFASLDGNSLVSETQHVHYYSTNISMEKLVMEQLLEGPVSNNAQSAIPAGTGLISVSVMDGVCFVNLDENFLSQNFDISEDVVIYSIVNSLCELPTVDTVQVSVNGETNREYRQELSLKEFYTMNKDLISEEGEDVEVNQQEKEGGILDTGEK